MGKVEEEQPLPSAIVVSEPSDQNVGSRCPIRGRVGFRCVLALLLGAAVMLSAIFWLPPFLQYADQRDLDLDSRFRGHDIVASFRVKKSISLLEDNLLQLENDIFVEIEGIESKVVVLSLEPSAGTNTTEVVFAVDLDAKSSRILTSQSLIRELFESLVTQQSSLHLTASLFGDPFKFEVLKFPEGITVSPPQSAFLLQKVQILFNFTLNFSIEQILENFNELTSQLKSGLHLASYENLYISLTNSKGSTVSPPTTVQSSVLLAVGNTPLLPRLKQLAQTITGSHSRNLGLNNTVFGRVKQVQLSSILQHSLHGGASGAPSSSPTPAPVPHPYNHRHHHHHHHHHHHNAHIAPTIAAAPVPASWKSSPAPEKSSPAPKKSSPAPKRSSPAPERSSPAPEGSSPAPERSYEARPPGCQNGHKRKFTGKTKKPAQSVPPVAPRISPHYSAASPHPQVGPPGTVTHAVPALSPLPSIVLAHAQPPSKSEFDAKPPDIMPSFPPSPSSYAAGLVPTVQWVFPLFLAFVLHL